VLSRYGLSRLTLHHHGLLWTTVAISVQIVMEADAGETTTAVAYLIASVIGGIVAAAAGYILGRKLSYS
jgi:fluoride ion exporter CrcB/FEX